jgi:hypothetical protein
MEAKPNVSPAFGIGEKGREGGREEEAKKAEPAKVEPAKKPEVMKAPEKPQSIKKPEVVENGKSAKKQEEWVEKKPEPQVRTPTEPAKPVEIATPKARTPVTKKRPLEPSEIRHSTRERKQVHLENVAAATIHHVPITVPSGHGTKLGDISHTHHELMKRKSSDAAVQQLHRLLYGRVGESGKRKEFLRKFNGFGDAKAVLVNPSHDSCLGGGIQGKGREIDSPTIAKSCCAA